MYIDNQEKLKVFINNFDRRTLKEVMFWWLFRMRMCVNKIDIKYRYEGTRSYL